MGKKKNRNRDVDYSDEQPPPSDNATPSASIPKKATNNTTRSLSSQDMINVRSEMKNILLKYPDKPDDWVARSIEKNLTLGKKTLQSYNQELSAMRNKVEREIDSEEPTEDDQDEDGQVDDEEDEERKRQEARARAEARMMGYKLDSDDNNDNDDDNDDDNKNDDKGKAPLPDVTEETALTGLGATLLSIKPLTSSDASSFPMSLLYLVAYYILSLIAGNDTCLLVEAVYNRDAPKREAEQKAKQLAMEQAQKEVDDEMRLGGEHLWCPNSNTWIKLDAVYTNTSSDESNKPPDNIRYENGRWEKWAKNLKTKVKKPKKNTPTTTATQSLRGTYLSIKPGEGWAIASNKLETPNSSLSDSDITFLGCIHDKQTIVDCTTWVQSALMTRGTARALDIVDSGKVLFYFGLDRLEEDKGVDSWVSHSYVNHEEEDQGDTNGGGGGKSKVKKEKKSRAEKKNKKMGYGR